MAPRVDDSTDALLVVDVQEDFLPGGALAVPAGDEIVGTAAELCWTFSTVVATQDFHPPRHVSFASAHPGKKPFDVLTLPGGRKQALWPDHCVAGSKGARLHPAIPDARLTLVLRKGTRRDVDSYSAFQEEPDESGARASTGLGAWLRARGIRRVFVAGLARDVCVSATALDAAAEGFESIVLDDVTRAVGRAPSRALDEIWARVGVQRETSGALLSP
jgi:nicotinamidase/pyrazinamidase